SALEEPMFPFFRRSLWLVPLVCVGLALAQEEAGKDAKGADKKDEAEVQFANGSIVRMAIVQDYVEVLTRYGKLTIPLADIQRIEFGVHLPPDVAKRVESAIYKLSSAQFSERDEGT